MAAVAMIPLSAMIGSGLDMSRSYLVKARLQSACDAGALATRKTMAAPGTLDDAAIATGKSYFNNNFPAGTYKVTGLTFTPTLASANEVQATATATVPMTLMTIFGYNRLDLKTACNARYDTADTDVMFVLDTTGSMACPPNEPDGCGQPTVSYTRPDGTPGEYTEEKTGSRLSALRSAVLTFYDTVAGSVDPSTHVRYGFVPYTSTVNAGAAIMSLSPNYMVSKWNYDTRTVVGDYNQGSATAIGPYTGVSQSYCNSFNGYRNPTTGYTSNGTAIVYATSWTPDNGGTCSANQQTVTPVWRYANMQLDVSQYIAGQTVKDPSKITGATSKWQGCIEERDTVPSMTFDQNALPADLDPDLKPTSDATRWRPMWSDLVYWRSNYTTVDYQGEAPPPAGVWGDSVYVPGWAVYASSAVSCGRPVQRLKPMLRSEVASYLNASDFVPWGGTYHDTGMIWGTRMIAPDGVFGIDTARWPNREEPNRYIVFMTDGIMSTGNATYGLWGFENYAKRSTGGDFGNSNAYHNARFLAECQAAKSRNITVFVVTVKTAPDSNLNTCASSGTAYFASDGPALTAAFTTIAKQVALLRLSK